MKSAMIHLLYNWRISDDGATKMFECARPLNGRYVFVEMVGVEASLSLCEVQVLSSGDGNYLILVLNKSESNVRVLK